MREFAIVMNQLSKLMFSRRTALCMSIVGLLFAAACGGSLYKVKPVVQAPIPEGAAGAAVGGVRLRAVPLLSDEEVQELFEANLLLAGVLPVRVEIGNQTQAPIDLKKSRFALRDAQERGWKTLAPKQAIARILDYYAVYAYNPSSRKKFEEDFRSHALATETPLAAGEQRSGLIFFQTPKKEPVASPRGLVLKIEKPVPPFEVRLN
jgi:hypothetical protein